MTNMAEWLAEADENDLPAEAWARGKRAAVDGHIASIGADHHIYACSPGPPWLEPKMPARQTGVDHVGKPLHEPRRITLHGGAYDGCLVDVYALGQYLTVGGEHGSVLHEHKEHDDRTADYTAVEDEWRPVDRHEATTAERPEGRGLTGSSRAGADRSETSQPTSAAPIGVPAATPPPDEPRSLFG